MSTYIRNQSCVVIGVLFVLSVAAMCFAGAAEDQHQAIGVQDKKSQVSDDPVRTRDPEAQWFGEAGLGLFIHWGLASAAPAGNCELSWSMMKDCPWNEENNGVVTPREYFKLAEKFQPDKYDPDKWLAAAAKAGFRYAVLTTKHHEGYALWPSQVGQFNTRTYMQGRDLVEPYVMACRKNGLKVGLYYSPPDWYLWRNEMSFCYGSGDEKNYPGRKPLGVDHEPIAPPQTPPGFNHRYKAYIRAQIVELLTQYGPIDLIWFDGGPEVISIDEIRQLQPHIVINPRMHGKADFMTPECQFPATRPTGWWELCQIWGRGWGYKKREEYNTTDWMLELLARTRGWGGNLLINVSPRPNGELPEVVYDRLGEVADWMSRNRESVFGVEAGCWPESCNVPVTRKNATWYLHVSAEFQGSVVLKNSQAPKAVTLLATGQKLDYTFADNTLRLEIPKSLRTNLLDVVKVEY